MLDIQDIWSAIDRGYEELAQMQFVVAKRSAVGGDPQMDDKAYIKSLELYMYLEALEIMSDDPKYRTARNTSLVVDNIKRLTKDFRLWN